MKKKDVKSAGMIQLDFLYQPRFQAYLEYTGKSKLSDIKLYEFQIWVMSNLTKFRKQHGINGSLTDKQHEEFTDYLFSLN